MNLLNLVTFKQYIDKLVSTAYYKLYTRCDSNYIEVYEINLDYNTNEDDYEAPFVMVKILYGAMGSHTTLTVSINLDESDEYNIGHICSALEREEDDE